MTSKLDKALCGLAISFLQYCRTAAFQQTNRARTVSQIQNRAGSFPDDLYLDLTIITIGLTGVVLKMGKKESEVISTWVSLDLEDGQYIKINQQTLENEMQILNT